MLPYPGITCEHFQLAKRVVVHKLVREGRLPASFLDPRGDRCFCRTCHSERGNAVADTRGGRPYLLPLGWCRVGLAIPRGFMEQHRPDKDWVCSYHGTTVESALCVIKGGLKLLFAGDIALGGEAVRIERGHIRRPFKRTNLFTGLSEPFNPNQIFTSPSIVYSGLPEYAPGFDVQHPLQPSTTLKDLRVAFQVLQRPGSFCIGQKTVDNTTDGPIDPLISNNKLEYYTREHTGMVISGLLVHLPSALAPGPEPGPVPVPVMPPTGVRLSSLALAELLHANAASPSVVSPVPDVSTVAAVLAELPHMLSAVREKLPGSEALGIYVCSGLVSFVRSGRDADRRALWEGGACDIITDMLRCHKSEPELVEAALETTAFLAADSSHQGLLGLAGACEGQLCLCTERIEYFIEVHKSSDLLAYRK